jgi:hypothetical protein
MKTEDPFQLLRQSEATLNKALEKAITALIAKRDQIDAQIETLRSRQRAIATPCPRMKHIVRNAQNSKRIRRSPQDLKKLAQDVLSFVKSNKNGVTGPELKQRFGVLVPTAKIFVRKHAGVKLHTAGAGARTVYSV